MKHIFVVFSILVLFLFPFQPLEVKAETTSIVPDYLEFDSFMKRYHEHVMELSYYVTTSYDSNLHYFKEGRDELRSSIVQAFEADKNGILDKYLEFNYSLAEKPMALIGVGADLLSYAWNGIKGLFGKEEVNPDFVYSNGTTARILTAPEGYEFYNLSNNVQHLMVSVEFSGSYLNLLIGSTRYVQHFQPSTELVNQVNSLIGSGLTIGAFQQIHALLNQPFNIVLVSTESNEQVPVTRVVYPPAIENIINNVTNGIDPNGKINEDYTPKVQPLLVCPSSTVPLTYQDGTFLTTEGQVITINSSEETNYLNELCNLDFKFPEIYYHEDTGSLIADGVDLIKSEGAIVPIDNSLVDYVRNSYNYATSVVNSGVNGLKSIIAGTAGLITFSSSLFGFLPPEILTLFIGGFSVALGLWVFKK